MIYTTKPGALTSVTICELTSSGISMKKEGGANQSISYKDIKKIQLSVNQQCYNCDIIGSDGNKITLLSKDTRRDHLRGSGELPYSDFIKELHRKVKANNRGVDLLAGSNTLYTLGIIGTIISVPALILVFVAAVSADGPIGAVFIVMIFLFANISWLKLKAKNYSFDQIPENYLP